MIRPDFSFSPPGSSRGGFFFSASAAEELQLIELREWISVNTPLGHGMAMFIEPGESDTFWTVALSDSCAIVTFPQEQIRISRSYSHGRGISTSQMRKIVLSKPAKKK